MKSLLVFVFAVALLGSCSQKSVNKVEKNFKNETEKDIKNEVEIDIKKKTKEAEVKKWVRPESAEYKELVANYDLVGKWEQDQSSSGNLTAITEIYKKENDYKCVDFYGDYNPVISNLKKKGDKYIYVRDDDIYEYYKIKNGTLQLWSDQLNSGFIYTPIDW